MAMWFDEEFENRVRVGFRVEEYIFRDKSDFQTVDIFDTVCFGRTLALDGVYQTSIGDEYLYHEMLVHQAMTTAPSIKNVLIIGGGDGGTAREVLSYPEVEKCTMVELDKLVVKACQEHMQDMQVPWDDPRLELHFDDGCKFVADSDELYDVILVDGPDPVGPAAVLYTNSFYASCRDHLTPQGVLSAQVEAPQLMEAEFTRIMKTLKNEFPYAEPYFGPVPIYVCGSWAYAYCTKDGQRFPLREDRCVFTEARARYWNRDIHQACFVQSNRMRALMSS